MMDSNDDLGEEKNSRTCTYSIDIHKTGYESEGIPNQKKERLNPGKAYRTFRTR